MTGTIPMLRKLLHANDGSEHAFHPLPMAFAIAKKNPSELNMRVREGASHSAFLSTAYRQPVPIELYNWRTVRYG
jgi:hypothetical protein